MRNESKTNKGQDNNKPNKRNTKEKNYTKNGKARKSQNTSGNRNYVPGRNDDTKSTTNDAAWYTINPQLARDAASIPFYVPTGTLIPQEVSGGDMGFSMPGICTIDVLPTVGFSDKMDSPVNLAAQNIYSYVRHANSGSSNYDAVDLMMYLCAMSQIYSAINWAQRIYGAIRMFTVENRYFGAALLAAMGVDPSTVYSGSIINDFRSDLNVIIEKAATFAVPKTMTLFKRQSFMFQNVYLDSTHIKDQLYMYNPQGFYFFDLDDEGKGYLTYKRADDLKRSLPDIIKYVNEMVERVYREEDFGIMNGDIIRAYGQDLIAIGSVPEDYRIAPIYDPVVLEQMKNATLMPYPIENLDITQSIPTDSFLGAPYIVCAPRLTQDMEYSDKVADLLTCDQLLYSDLAEPSPADVLEMSRLTTTLKRMGDGSADRTIIHGTEIATTARVWYFSKFSGDLIFDNFYYINICNDPDTLCDKAQTMLRLDAFNCHPKAQFFYDSPSLNAFIKIGDSASVANYTVVSPYVLERMHRAAVLSEFSVPAIAKYTQG